MLTRTAICVVIVLTFTLGPLIGSANATEDQPSDKIRLVYELEDAGPRTMARAIRQRLAPGRNPGIETAGIEVKVLEDRRIQLLLPPSLKSALPRLRDLIEAPGVLEFLIVASKQADQVLAQRAADADAFQADQFAADEAKWVVVDPEKVKPQDQWITRTVNGKMYVLVLTSEPRVDGSQLATLQKETDGLGHPALSGSMSNAGARRLQELSRTYLPDPDTGRDRQLAIVMDGRILTAPSIRAEISKRFVMTGNFTDAEIDTLVSILRAGRLPGRLKTPPQVDTP